MKIIHKFQSMNFDSRNNNAIKYIIIHYTALRNFSLALDYLCNQKNRVSCHYLISQSGKIYSLVPDKKRAWHAGLSFWDSDKDINSMSIGIELDFSNYPKNNSYNLKMIQSLENLLMSLKKKYKIKKNNILGHSDIAPYRKIDPGPKFPWKKLSKKDLTFINTNIEKKYIIFFRKWLRRHKIYSIKKSILFMLAYIGYDVSLSYKNNKYFNLLLTNYHNHYLQNKYTSKIKIIRYLEIHFLNLLLNK